VARGHRDDQRARLVAFIDIAYQGFADGISEDALALRLFADSGLQFLVASSFSKVLLALRRAGRRLVGGHRQSG
jgi:aspartate/tyrosine/aromatic aminotransferase